MGSRKTYNNRHGDKMAFVGLRVDVGVTERLDAVARRSGVERSKLIRRYIQEGLRVDETVEASA